MARVLSIGLDAASVPLLERMMRDGELPHLQRVHEASARWTIDGGDACLRNLQWAQFNFGRRVERDCGRMFWFDPDTYRCVLEDARHELDGVPQFWDRDDVKALVLDVPESALVGTGVAVNGWGAHAPQYPRSSNPAGLLSEIDRAVGVHPGFANDFDAAWHDRQGITALRDGLVVGARRRAEAFDFMSARHPDWDLAIVVMSELHSAGHYWWHAMEPGHPMYAAPNVDVARDALERVYRAVDDALGAMVSAAPTDTTIVVFSPDDIRYGHGDVPTIVLLPELLHRLEIGSPMLASVDAAAWKAAGCPPAIPRQGIVWREHVDSMLVRPSPFAISKWKQLGAYRRAKRSWLGRRLISAVKRRPLGAIGVAIPPEATAGVLDHDRHGGTDTNDILFTAHYQPYWSRMRAFAVPSFNPGAVRINLVGRERDGIVPLADYEKVCDEVEAAVRSCVNPRTGASIVERVDRPRRDDPLAPDGDFADLVFKWVPNTLHDAIEHPDLGVIGPVPAHRSGVHDRAGFLFVRRDGMAPGDRGAHHAVDIPATLLHLVDAERGAQLDGRSVLDQDSAVTPA